MENKNFGYIAPIITPDHYVSGMGLVPDIELQPMGQWQGYARDELQNRNGLESMSCATFATLNALEILLRRKFNIDNDYSERYTSIIGGTSHEGADPQNIAQAIKNCGVIFESLLPFSPDIDTWEKFFAPKPMIEPYLSKGKDWLIEYIYRHEWLWDNDNVDKVALIKNALRFSPVCASVCAWTINEQGLYTKEGRDNHFITIIGYQEGQFWEIEDQYEPFKKRLIWNYNFGFAKRFHVEQNQIAVIQKKISLLQIIMNLLRKINSYGH